jgi:hypothetical protein
MPQPRRARWSGGAARPEMGCGAVGVAHGVTWDGARWGNGTQQDVVGVGRCESEEEKEQETVLVEAEK